MKAAGYSRFSTDRQNESSIADQVRVCAEYAARQGWQVVEYFEDQGISGAHQGKELQRSVRHHYSILLVNYKSAKKAALF